MTKRLLPSHVIALLLLAAGCGDDPDAGPGPDAGPDTGGADVVPRFEATTCRMALPSGHMEDQTVTCGDLVVYESRTATGDDQAQRRTIRLHVARFRGAGDGPPAVALMGGPGQSMDSLIQLMDSELARPLLAHSDLILLEQRGIGYSEPALDCPELDVLAPGEGADALSAYVQALDACQTRLTQRGIDLTAYTTTENAADVAELRLAMGLESMSVFGFSYGTRLGLEVLRNHPEGLHAVVLDSVVPPQAAWFLESGANHHEALGRLFDACAAQSACSDAYGDLPATLIATVQALDQSPLELPGLPIALSGGALVSMLRSLMYEPQSYASIPAIVEAASQRRGDQILTLLAPLFAGAEAARAYEGMHFSVLCNDHLRAVDDQRVDMALAGVPAELAAVFRTEIERYRQVCALWPKGPEDLGIFEPVRADVPTLLLSGELDPVTPSRYARLAAETLERAQVVEIPRAGHVPFSSHGCAIELSMAFVRDPAAPLDTGCTADIPEIQFQLPGGAARTPPARARQALGSALQHPARARQHE